MNDKSHRRAQSKGNARIAKQRVPKYSSLTPREKAERERALALLSDLRRGKGSYSALLRKHQLDSSTARKHLGRNLLGGAGGTPVRATKADKLVRDLMFPTAFGDVRFRTRSSEDATKLSDYYQDRDKLLRGKLRADDFEAKWEGMDVADREVFADAAEILRMANADVLKLENLYASVGSTR